MLKASRSFPDLAAGPRLEQEARESLLAFRGVGGGGEGEEEDEEGEIEREVEGMRDALGGGTGGQGGGDGPGSGEMGNGVEREERGRAVGEGEDNSSSSSKGGSSSNGNSSNGSSSSLLLSRPQAGGGEREGLSSALERGGVEGWRDRDVFPRGQREEGWSEMVRGANRKALIIACGLVAFQQVGRQEGGKAGRQVGLWVAQQLGFHAGVEGGILGLYVSLTW